MTTPARPVSVEPVIERVRRLIRADPALYSGTLRGTVPDGATGTDATLAAMRAAAIDASRGQLIGRVASAIVGACRNRDVVGQALALHSFIRDGVNFKPDPLGAEVLRHPDQLVYEIGSNGRTAADCDDVATLAASILIAMGVPAAFVICRRSPGGPFVHVHYAARLTGSAGPWVPFDPQERRKPGAWTAPPELREVRPL